jgi:hypothetical protein
MWGQDGKYAESALREANLSFMEHTRVQKAKDVALDRYSKMHKVDRATAKKNIKSPERKEKVCGLVCAAFVSLSLPPPPAAVYCCRMACCIWVSFW